jgi:hypothetical protein
MMSTDTKLKRARESRGSPPVDYFQRPHRSAPIVFSQNLHSKGFGGGVPLNPLDKLGVSPEPVEGPNTETAAVNLRVGIE